MTRLSKFHKWSIGFLALSLVLVAALFLGVTTPALAQDNPTRPTPSGANLELFYQRELLISSRQALALENAGRAITGIENLIARLQSEGYDTTDLETALTAYQSSVADAQLAHNNAESILNTHAGFDSNGNVTDFAQALETLRDAGQYLRETNLKLRTGNLNMRLALNTWRNEHRSS